MLTSTARQSTPSASMSGAAVSSSSGALLAMTTFAPSCAKPSAIALPMPRPPPVTTAVFPAKRPGAYEARGSNVSLMVGLLPVGRCGSESRLLGPRGALLAARVIDDAALDVEGHHRPLPGRVRRPARIARRGEREPAVVHVVGELLRRRRAGDQRGAGRRELVEDERDLEVVAGAEPAAVLRGAPGELVHPGRTRAVVARLGEADVREPEEVVGGGGGVQLAGRRAPGAVRRAQALRGGPVDPQRGVDDLVAELLHQARWDQEE